MITSEFAQNFAQDWIEAWNNHNLERILSHYSDTFEMTSPYIMKITGEDLGTLTGKTAIKAYWEKALQDIPTLHFELIECLLGVDSVTLYYKSLQGRAAETFFFNEQGKVTHAFAHYSLITTNTRRYP